MLATPLTGYHHRWDSVRPPVAFNLRKNAYPGSSVSWLYKSARVPESPGMLETPLLGCRERRDSVRPTVAINLEKNTYSRSSVSSQPRKAITLLHPPRGPRRPPADHTQSGKTAHPPNFYRPSGSLSNPLLMRGVALASFGFCHI